MAGANEGGSDLLTIFEMVNETRHEVYVGATGLLSEAIAQDFRTAPPAAAAHWLPADKTRLRCISYSVAKKDAAAFIADYAAGAALETWTVLRASA